MNKIVLIFPCYNEEEVIVSSKKIILEKLENLIFQKKLHSESRICFVDDGSKDKTWEIISSFEEEEIIGIKLSRNYGHQFALLAGLESLKDQFDAYITLDVDLQDDIDSLSEMIDSYHTGNEIVYGVRNDRKTDDLFKRKSANFFYLLMKKMGVDTIHNHADYRLINNRALTEFLKYKESHLFLRGIFPLIGFKQGSIYYKRQERQQGTSKYPLKKMLSFAWEGITSFSNKPLKIVLFIGIMSILISALLFIYALIQMFRGNVVTGWTSTTIIIIFFGGLQTFSIGIIGEYIGKMYLQVKQRPRYTIEKITTND